MNNNVSYVNLVWAWLLIKLIILTPQSLGINFYRSIVLLLPDIALVILKFFNFCRNHLVAILLPKHGRRT